jgi:ubiquinone/menaquinone biosynthesis C-methylase UbiE
MSALQLEKNDRVLDVGCGPGMWTMTAAPEVALVVGLDIVEKSVFQGKVRAWRGAYANIHWVIASATALPFVENSFDKIICVDVLDNIPDDQRAANELWRVLRAGGIAVVTALLQNRRHFFRYIRFPEHIRNYSTDGLAELLKKGGFNINTQFEFYRAFSTLAREAGDWFFHSSLNRVKGLGFLWSIILVTLAGLDRFSKRPGGGVGFKATRQS